MSKTEKKNPLKLRKKTYGDMTKEEAFTKALEPYFNKEKRQIVS